MRNKLLASLIITSTSAVVVVIFAGIGLLEPFSLKMLDLQQRWHHDADASEKRIVIVNVDQKSLDYFEQDNISFPWPRSLYNPIIDYTTKAGAHGIIFDILFNNTTNYGPDVDDEFAEAIRKSGRVILAGAFSSGGTAAKAIISVPGSLPFRGAAPASIQRNSVSLPVESLSSAASIIGSVSQSPDEDGIYRRIAPFIEYRGHMVPALGLAPLLTPASSIEWNEEGVTLDALSIPTNRNGEALLRFDYRFDQFKLYSAADVILSELALEQGESPIIPIDDFRDTYVFVGYTAPGLFDLNPTPIHSRSPGVAIHATLLANALDGHFLVPVSMVWQWLSGVVIALLSTMIILMIRRTRYSIPLLAALVAGMLVITQASFLYNHVWDLPQLFITQLIAILLAGTYRYQTEGKQRRFLQNAFSRYVSPQVVQNIVESPGNLKLGGDSREITVLFSDLMGFTTLTEKLSAEELIGVLNAYTTLMTETIIEHHGTVDKFIGDAVMAFWGAPLEQPNQSELAIQAALAFQDRFNTLCAEQFPDHSLGVRIGIDRGTCILGNVGSEIRFDYTAIGDAVNQASRLEGLNKFYFTCFLVGEAAWKHVDNRFIGRPVDYLAVKGKEQPTLVYEIMATLESATEEQKHICHRYTEAFEHYRARNWEEAMDILKRLIAEAGDKPSEVLLQRIREYIKNPPETGWDGAYKHTTK